MLQQLYRGKCIPTTEHGGNLSSEYSKALQNYKDIIARIRSYGVPEEVLQALDKAENELMALEEERMFCFAIRYGAKLQRNLL